MKRFVLILAFVVSFATATFADCIPFSEAPKKIGTNACVTGKVLKIGHTKSGTTFLDFCDDYKNCPFVVVIFRSNLRDVGDVSKLEGKEIQITGKIEEFNGRAEIVLKDIKQLRGEAANVPPLPKNYDASRHGSYSAGTITPSRKTSKQPSTLSDDKEFKVDRCHADSLRNSSREYFVPRHTTPPLPTTCDIETSIA